MTLPEEPENRREQYLASIAGQEVTLPAEPASREEEYLDYIAKNGGGGGGTSDFDQLSNRPKYDNATMTKDTNIPKVVTYSNFTGTTGTTAGAPGLVPGPATTDAGKFLAASGLWEAISGGAAIHNLTTADFNWNSTTHTTTDPDTVAIWLLPDGLYTNYELTNAQTALNDSATIQNTAIISVSTINSDGDKLAIWLPPGGSYQMAYGTTYANGTRRQTTQNILSTSDIKNNLTTTTSGKALDARQGKTLKTLIDESVINGGTTAPTSSTAGAVGTLYSAVVDGTPKLYTCTAASGGSYTWTAIV